MSFLTDLIEKFGRLSRTSVMLFFVFLVVPLFGGFVLWTVASILYEMKQDMPVWLLSFYLLAPKLTSSIFPLLMLLPVLLVAANVIFGIQQESKSYARSMAPREISTAAAIPDLVEEDTDSNRLRQTVRQLRDELATLKDVPREIDISNPDKVFQVARQRLLDEAVRIDSISRRNLIIGIMFSIIALAVLAWPLIAAAFQQTSSSQEFSFLAWASQYYLPRFAVGLLLQFVGFFFLRLYVANELDLKHNKNEITNFEMKMIGVQLAQAFGDGPSKKEIVKSLAATERNFLIKKNERTISTEAISEYNDMKGLLEKLVNKMPGKDKSS